jgi:hypothetical protein
VPNKYGPPSPGSTHAVAIWLDACSNPMKRHESSPSAAIWVACPEAARVTRGTGAAVHLLGRRSEPHARRLLALELFAGAATASPTCTRTTARRRTLSTTGTEPPLPRRWCPLPPPLRLRGGACDGCRESCHLEERVAWYQGPGRVYRTNTDVERVGRRAYLFTRAGRGRAMTGTVECAVCCALRRWCRALVWRAVRLRLKDGRRPTWRARRAQNETGTTRTTTTPRVWGAAAQAAAEATTRTPLMRIVDEQAVT